MDLLELGHVAKAHGLRGDVIMNLTTDRTGERMAPGAVLYLGRSSTDAERYAVDKGQPYQGKWLVHLDGVSGRDQADLLRGLTVFGEHLSDDELLDDDVIFVHELIGLDVVDQHGTAHGSVSSVIDNPASDLLELVGGQLIPLSFYVAHDAETITVEVPPGLLDGEATEAR